MDVHGSLPPLNTQWHRLFPRASAARFVALGMAMALVVAPAPLPARSNEVDPGGLPVKSRLAQRLRDHVEYLASDRLHGRETGTAGNLDAARYITRQFQAAGLIPLRSLRAFGQTISPEIGDNLVALRPALTASQDSPFVLIGAHYDHLGGSYLGADDNASGVAILLEVAKMTQPLTDHHVLFVAFNAEEPPYIRTPLMGSQHFVDHLPAEIENTSRFKVAVIMDLMGGVHWEPVKDAIFAAGPEKSPGLYRHLNEATAHTQKAECTMLHDEGRALPFSTQHAAFSVSCLSVLPLGIHLVEKLPVIGHRAVSDYDAFRNAGVPFLFLSSGRTPRYHETSDLPATLHYERMAATVRWLRTLLRLIDQDRLPYRFEQDRLEFADEVATLRLLLEQAARWETRIPNTSRVTLWRLQEDSEWMRQLDHAGPTPETIRRLERISIRMQCLLADFWGCFLF